MLPKDLVILLGYVNTKLRDDYSSLDELCNSLGCNKDELEKSLGEIGYYYSDKTNQFK